MEEANWRDADPADVVDVMAPEIERARAAGVTALIEATPEGWAGASISTWPSRRPPGSPSSSRQASTRSRRSRSGPARASEDELAAWMVEELTEGVDDTGVRAAWIKVKVRTTTTRRGSPTTRRRYCGPPRGQGPKPTPPSAVTRSTVTSSTSNSTSSKEAGYDADRFIWIHAQADDERYHREVAERRAFVEYDWIGGDDQADADYVDHIETMIDAGYTDNLLLSQDRGWYDPSEPGGGEQKPYTYLVDEFLSKLRESGVDEETVRRITHDNPFDAYAR